MLTGASLSKPRIEEFPVCLYIYICHMLCRKSFATLILCIVHHMKKMDETFSTVATQEVDCLQVACDSLFCIFTVAVSSHGQTSSVSIQQLGLVHVKTSLIFHI